MNLTQINILLHNTQFLKTKQRAYHSFFCYNTSWFDSVCFTVARWVNFRENIYMNINYSYPTTNYESIFRQIYLFLVEKHFCLEIFS